jgi:acyl-CoA thioester hydrolase
VLCLGTPGGGCFPDDDERGVAWASPPTDAVAGGDERRTAPAVLGQREAVVGVGKRRVGHDRTVARRHRERIARRDDGGGDRQGFGCDRRLPGVSRTYTHDIEVQFRDLDTRSHVNHVVYASYLEQAKGQFFREVFGVSLADAPTVVRTLDLEFRSSIEPDRTATVTLGPVDVGTSSIAIDYTISVDGTTAATARTVSVYLGEDGTPAAVPTAWRERARPYATDESETDA